MDDAEAERWAEAAARAVRAQRGAMTQEELAERADVSVDIVQFIEAGRFESRKRSTLGQVSRALGWEPDRLERMLAGEPAPWESYDARVEALEAAVVELRQADEKGDAAVAEVREMLSDVRTQVADLRRLLGERRQRDS